MNTAFLLMARYDGLPIIPVDVVCKDYFAHLTVEKFLRKVLSGEISLPIVRMEGKSKRRRASTLPTWLPISTNKPKPRARNARS